MQIQFSTTLGPYFAELVCGACGTVCLRPPRFGPVLGAFGTHCRMYGSTLGRVGPIFAHVGPMLVMLGNVGPALGPYCAYLEPFWAALEQGRPANMAGGQPAHKTVVQVSQHSSKQTWQEVSLDTARTPTCRCNSAMAARTQFGTPGTAAASAARTPTEHSCIRNSAVAARTYFGTPPKAGQPVQQGLSVGEQPGQTRGQVSQHSSICRRTWDAHQAWHHSSSNLRLTLYWLAQRQPADSSNPPLGSSLPADSQTHGSTNSPTNMGGGVNTAMAKAGGNMHSPADGSTPKFGGFPHTPQQTSTMVW